LIPLHIIAAMATNTDYPGVALITGAAGTGK